VAALSGGGQAATLSGLPAILIIAPGACGRHREPSNGLPRSALTRFQSGHFVLIQLRLGPLPWCEASRLLTTRSKPKRLQLIEQDWTVGKGGLSGADKRET
jgi:hypothetical protein